MSLYFAIIRHKSVGQIKILMALDKKLLQFILRGTWMSNFYSNASVEVFQSGPKISPSPEPHCYSG